MVISYKNNIISFNVKYEYNETRPKKDFDGGIMSYKQIYPPWYEIATLLYYTVGQDPYVYIMEPECEEENIFKLGIAVTYRQQADYIRIIIPTEYRSGNTTIYTHVYCQDEEIYFSCIPQKNQRDVANVFCNALRTNPLFLGTILVPQSFLPLKSYVEVCVVKDYLPVGGYCHAQYRISVADAFAQVIKLEYGILITTEAVFRGHCLKEMGDECLYCKGNWGGCR